MKQPLCRSCRNKAGQIVLDLGEQPACDYFPGRDDPGPDPVYPLQMWLCETCGLAQLAADPTVPEEPLATEPAVLARQAADAVGQAAAAGLLPTGARVAEYGSPHGGSWLALLQRRGLALASTDAEADVIVDCFGMMHSADQSAALAARAARLSADGVLLVQYHSLDTIITKGQWNALRHGHFAYYSTTTMVTMLEAHGLRPVMAWRFDLYGGTVLLAASHADRVSSGEGQAAALADMLANDMQVGVRDPAVLVTLQRDVEAQAAGLRDWLEAERVAGRQVLGYGAASRAVALLCLAGADRGLLPAVADAATAKQHRRMPGTDIPIVSPARLTASPPDSVLLFVPDLRAEVGAAYPEVDASGGRWIDAHSLARDPV